MTCRNCSSLTSEAVTSAPLAPEPSGTRSTTRRPALESVAGGTSHHNFLSGMSGFEVGGLCLGGFGFFMAGVRERSSLDIDAPSDANAETAGLLGIVGREGIGRERRSTRLFT